MNASGLPLPLGKEIADRDESDSAFSISSVAAVIVDYMSAQQTVQAIVSLREQGVSQIVVVDNADTCDPNVLAGTLGEFDPPVQLVRPGVNLGYGAGINRGVASIDGNASIVLVCNPDLVFDQGSISNMIGAFDPSRLDPIAIVGPRICSPDGATYPSARRFPDPVTAAVHALAGFFRPGNRFSKKYRMEDIEMGESTQVDWVSGACMMVRRDCFEALGGFDEAFFMYVEDVDLCWRARVAGWRVVYVPSAKVVHLQGVSTRTRKFKMIIAHHRSAMLYAKRTMVGIRRPLFVLAVLALGARLVFALVEGVFKRS
ncbi:MAG TPA: glycosyltransferase family 2 protein [Acidimicrobiales bacterium]|nr:glycosyltransferase family 2 protein [Acidimicrobiales bacterium]